MGGDEGAYRHGVHRQRRASIEAEPSEPQDSHSKEAQRNRMRDHGLPGPAPPASKHQNDGERRESGVDLDHGPSSEIENPVRGEPALRAEDPVSQRDVDAEQPERDQDDERGKLDSVGGAAADERGGDDGEHQLERQHRHW